jgi:hypothetical protein
MSLDIHNNIVNDIFETLPSKKERYQVEPRKGGKAQANKRVAGDTRMCIQ